jgi:hypothetical protein
MSHVSDIHNVVHFVAGEAQSSDENVFENIGLKVTDVLVVVNGRAAAINSEMTGLEGLKRFEASGPSIINYKFAGGGHTGSPVKTVPRVNE